MYNTITNDEAVPEGWEVVYTCYTHRLIKYTEREDPFWATSKNS